MKRSIILLFIILLAGFLRCYRLTQVPPALNSDEVAIGYNAYSILKTGRDEYGIRYPLTFRSFDDYKMPVYIYMVSGAIQLFGYNDFAVRFPSAFFGTITVYLTYLLTKKLLKRRSVALCSAFLLAISPWSFQFSRAGYEANVAVFLVVLGAYLLLSGLKRGWYIVLSAVIFSIAIWTYLTTRIFVPLLVFGFAVINAKELWKKKMWVIASILVGIVLLLPIIRMSFSAQGQMRAAGVSAFANPDDLNAFSNPNDLKKAAFRATLDIEKGLRIFTPFDNRRLVYALIFLRGYFVHFDPNFLFLDKSIEKFHAPVMGLLYLFELPLLLVGTYILVKRWSQGSAVIFWWLLVAPVAAAFTLQLPHPVRTLVFLPAFQIVSAVGLVAVWEKTRYARVGILFIILLSFVYYLHQYFIILPVEDASDWYVGRREMVQKLASIEHQYDKIIVSNTLDFPYIFFLYYRQVDPAEYLRSGGTVSGGFTEQNNRYGQYEFRSLSPSQRSGLEKVLFVGLPLEVFKQNLVVSTINYPDGSPAIVLFK